MPIKKDKRKKKKITFLKQKQKQTQTQKVVINLADLVKRRPRAKPLVEPKKKEPHEMILTRVIREPAVDTRQPRQPRRRQDDPTLIEEKELKALRKRMKEEEMERIRDDESELMKQRGYKSIPTTVEGFRKLEKDYKAKNLYKSKEE